MTKKKFRLHENISVTRNKVCNDTAFFPPMTKTTYDGKRDKEGLEWFCKKGQGKSTCYHIISPPYHNINPGHIEESNVQ